MKRNLIKLGVFLIAVALVLSMSIVAFAAGEEYTRDLTVRGITVSTGDKTIDGVYSDPVDYWEEVAAGALMDHKILYDAVGERDSIIYTAFYPDTTTGREGAYTDYVFEFDGQSYVVTAINTEGDGSTYIPVGGFVLSIYTADHPDFAKVGDIATLGGAKLTIPTKAVESKDGKRIAIDSTNGNRSGPMVVYYDTQFGEKTGTNVWGTEVICQFNFDKNTFEVVGLRDFGEGDDSGSFIPDNGFVLSAFGPGYRQLLSKDILFDIGDEMKLVGFDYVRFGGTVYGTYDHVNPTKESNPAGMETPTSEFGAFRGPDQTIVYKSGWKYKESTGTGTNVYGYEAAVDADGIVVELGVNVSKIPEGGYVISGHGKGRDFIRANFVLGATVVLDEENKTYSVSTTLNSYYETLVTSVNSAIDSAEARIKQLYDVNAELIHENVELAKSRFESLRTLKEEIEKRLEDPNLTEDERLSMLMNYNKNQVEIDKIRQKLIVLSADSNALSARAVWHRPIEATYAEIKENVEMYKRIGINLVFVETLYNGYSTFRSEVKEFPYHVNLASAYNDGNGHIYDDYFSAFLACCLENGIEVHAWVENFYVGLKPDAEVLKLHPDWVMYNDNGTTVQRNEGGPYYFIDPANKEVQDTLIKYYNELFKKHPEVAGLNLDYIRYPVSDKSEDTGYTIAAMKGFYDTLGKEFNSSQLSDRTKMYNKFKQLFDKDYLLGGQKEADENYDKWVEYRMGVITEYVRRIKDEVKKPNGIMLSTSVFASLTESTGMKKQDWKSWFNNGWIDIATPMAYYTDASDVNARVSDMILMGGNNCLYYTGIASSYSGLPAWQNKLHIEASYNAGAQGYVIFCSTQILGHADVQDALSSGVNSKSAVLPHAAISEVLAASFGDILDRADRLYIPAGGMTEEKRAALAEAFSEIEGMSANDAVEIYKIFAKVQNLTKTSVIKAYASGYSRQRIIEQLEYLADILDARISMQLISDGVWDPEKIPTRPTVNENGVTFPDTTPDDNETPDPGTTPDDGGSEKNEEPEKENFFVRIWRAIVNFFKRLFGKKD